MKTFLCTVAAVLLIGSPAFAQATASHSSTTKATTTTNGKVTSSASTTKAKTCHNEKGQFVACSSVTKTSVRANVAKDAKGKCHFTSGPNKGRFTKCPASLS